MTFDEIAQFLISNEASMRLSAFLTIFAIMASWEVIKPCRRLLVKKSKRWLNNLGLVVVNSLVLRLLFPAAAVGMAQYVGENNWGVFNQTDWPILLEVVICVVILDFMIYWQHVISHMIPMLWKFHRVHHADLDFDVTTGARFHPVEIVLSMCLKFFIILLLGPPVVAVFIFELLLNGSAMFNHSNVSLPKRLDNILRWIIVTPDMHRIHHSIYPHELDTNFGFNLSVWDRLFGSYTLMPQDGNQGMTIGINSFRREQECAQLRGMLAIPFMENK